MRERPKKFEELGYKREVIQLQSAENGSNLNRCVGVGQKRNSVRSISRNAEGGYL